MKIELVESFNVLSEHTLYCIIINGSSEKCFHCLEDATKAVERLLVVGSVEVKKTIETYEVA